MKNCGDCKYYRQKDGRMGECFSHPPMVMAGTRSGRVRCFRPVVQNSDPICSEYRKAESNDNNKRSDNEKNGTEGPRQAGSGDAGSAKAGGDAGPDSGSAEPAGEKAQRKS